MTDLAAARPRRWPWLNLVLFLATVASTLAAGALQAAPADEPLTLLGAVRHGWPYAAALLAILGTHEMGHFVLARRHGVDVSWPYFIPMPLGFIGTLGAVIRMRETPPSRRALLDIGVAGPIAGFLVALPVLLWGLAHSTLVDAPVAGVPRSSPLDLLLAWLAGRAAEEPGGLQVMGDSLLTWGAQRLVWGALPAGKDLLLHPVATAAWLGMLVTALNLVPVGQLDGGHLTHAWLGPARAERASRLVLWALLVAGLTLSWNWLVWWALVRFVVGVRHPRSLDERPLDPTRRALAVAGLILFALTFVPVPFAF